jgi:hypothetical protein
MLLLVTPYLKFEVVDALLEADEIRCSNCLFPSEFGFKWPPGCFVYTCTACLEGLKIDRWLVRSKVASPIDRSTRKRGNARLSYNCSI